MVLLASCQFNVYIFLLDADNIIFDTTFSKLWKQISFPKIEIHNQLVAVNSETLEDLSSISLCHDFTSPKSNCSSSFVNVKDIENSNCSQLHVEFISPDKKHNDIEKLIFSEDSGTQIVCDSFPSFQRHKERNDGKKID